MIAVVGSVNQDLVVRVAQHPQPGETVLGLGHDVGPGGKGANQAVAAARLGADVCFVGRIGADEAGAMLLAAFDDERVDTGHLTVDAVLPTGLAVITVDQAGENSIVVDPGANGGVTEDDVSTAGDVLAAAGVTLLQLEIPLAAIGRAAQLSRGTVILNPAPAQALSEELLANVGLLVPNRHELERLTGSADPASARDLSVPATIVTLGSEGAAIVTADGVDVVPAPMVNVVDTTGAGDAFVGALGEGLDRGLDLEDAVHRAVRAGALAVTAPGARGGMATAQRLTELR
jgi:ribokinase